VTRFIVPFTLGSITTSRPVTTAMVRATASMSALKKFRVMGSPPAGAALALAGVRACVGEAAAPADSSVTLSELPCISVLYEAGCHRFSTTRLRSPACTTLIERRLAWFTSTAARPTSLATPGKSSAMRGGFCMANPPGSSSSGCARSIWTTAVPCCT